MQQTFSLPRSAQLVSHITSMFLITDAELASAGSVPTVQRHLNNSGVVADATGNAINFTAVAKVLTDNRLLWPAGLTMPDRLAQVVQAFFGMWDAMVPLAEPLEDTPNNRRHMVRRCNSIAFCVPQPGFTSRVGQ